MKYAIALLLVFTVRLHAMEAESSPLCAQFNVRAIVAYDTPDEPDTKIFIHATTLTNFAMSLEKQPGEKPTRMGEADCKQNVFSSDEDITYRVHVRFLDLSKKKFITQFTIFKNNDTTICETKMEPLPLDVLYAENYILDLKDETQENIVLIIKSWPGSEDHEPQ